MSDFVPTWMWTGEHPRRQLVEASRPARIVLEAGARFTLMSHNARLLRLDYVDPEQPAMRMIVAAPDLLRVAKAFLAIRPSNWREDAEIVAACLDAEEIVNFIEGSGK